MAKSSYLSNVLKSIKYATIDTVAEMNPVIVEQYSSAKDFVQDTIDEIKEKASDKNPTASIKGTISKTYRNLKEDLASGNFYNKTRIEEEENKAMEKVFGIDFSSFDSLDDAFNENDSSDDGFNMDSFGDFDSDSDDEISSSDKYTANVMALAMGKTSNAIKKSNSKSTRAIGGLMVETSKFNADVIMASTERMITGISAASGIVHNDLTAMNANLGKVVEFTNDALRTHIENSTTFFETQKQQMQEQTNLLKEIRDMQAEIKNGKQQPDDDKVNISDLFGSEGSLDLSSYKKYLKQNKGGLENTEFGMLTMIPQFAPLLMAGITGSPLSVPMKAMIKKAIPTAVKDAFESINDTISGAISTALVNLTQAKSGKNGGFFQFLGDMFGLTVPDLKMDLSKYNKEAMSWTGKDHKALTEVIPTWLSKIYSGITGREEQRFDYNKGQFISASQIKKKYDNSYNAAVADANYSINEELEKNIDKIRFSNEKDRKDILDAIDKIEKYNFKNMKNFNPNSKRAQDLDPKTYGISGPNADKIMQIVRVLYKNVDKRTQLKGSNELLNAISSYNEDIRDAETTGDSVYNALFNGSMDESKLMDTPIMASAKRLDTTNSLLEDILHAINNPGSKTTTTTVKSDISTVTGGKNSTSKTATNIDGTKKKIDPNSFDIDTDDPEKINKMLEEAEPEEITETYISQIQKADRASEKLKAFFNGFALLTKKPAEFLKNTINTVDVYAYDLFFGNGEEDVHSISQKLAKGFDDVFAKIKEKTSSTFKAIKDELAKEGGTTANGIFKALFGIDMNQFSKDFKRAMFGDESKPFFQGMGETIRKGFGEIVDDIFGPVKKYFGKNKDKDADLLGDIKKAAGAGVDKLSDKYADSKKKQKEKEELAKNIAEGNFEGGIVGTGSTIGKLKKDEKKNKKFKPPIQNAAAGLKVTKTGLVAVSEGERIVPNYMDEASIAGRQIKENSAINKFRHAMGLGDVKIESFAKGGKRQQKKNAKKAANSGGIQYSPDMSYKQFNKFYNTLLSEEEKQEYRARFAKDYADRLIENAKQKGAKTAQDAINMAQSAIDSAAKKNPALADAIKDQVNTIAKSTFVSNIRKGFRAAKGYVGQLKEEAINTGKAAKEAFFSDEDELTKSVKYLAERFAVGKEGKEAAADVAKNWKNYLPKSLAGAGIGAGLSILFGLAGGPILGAAVGAATALTTKSNAVQKLLFGEKEVDKEGNVIGRKGNLFSKQISTAVQKYAPDMAKSGALGGLIASLPFMPGGPVTGIMVGSAIGFAKNNEQIKETLFGKDSILKNAPQIIKKKLPKMGLGALTGALMGPFGLTTNLMIGSALGFASDNEKFKGLLLGTKGIDGKYGGGLIGFIKNSLSIPVKGLGDLIDETREFFNKEIFEPLKRAGKVFFRQFQNIFYWIGDKVADTFTTHVWKPIGNLIALKLIQPLEKVAGALFNIPKFLGKSMIKIAMSPIKMISDRLEARQLSKVGAAGGTAQDRIAQRQMMLDRYQENVDKTRRGPLKGLRKARAQRKYDKLQEKLTNSEANRQDVFMADPNMDIDQMRQMLLVNESLGKLGGVKNKQKAIKKYAKGILSHTNLNEILNSHVARDQIAEQQRKLIIKEVAKGEYKKSTEQIMQYTDLPEENKFALCAKIKEVALKVKKGIEIAEKATETRDEWKSKFGINIGGAAQRRQLERQIESMELKEQKAMPDPEKITEGLTPETTSEKYLFGISSDVHTIAKAFINRHDALRNAQEQADQIRQNAGVLALPGPTIDNQYELTENGMVKMKRNDQGELEPDEQDSQTRETLKRRDDKEETQKGILGKLTGIGTSVLEFFGKKKEKKKPNVFEKILSVLGMGFSFLGGSKLFTALKVAGLATGAAYILGKDTGVVKTDENGNELHDEYGNPIFKTVGEVIGDKISGIVIGIKDWVVKTAWPGIKNFFLGILPTVKKFVIDEFIPTAITGFKTVFGGVTDIAESIVDFATTKFIPALVTSFIDHIPDLAAAVGNSILEGLGWKKKEEKTEEVSPTAHTDGFQSQISKSSGTVSSNGIGGTFSSRSGNSNSTGGSSQQYTISDSEIEEQLKNSTPYKNVKNKDLQQRILSSKEIKNNWFTSYNLPDGTSRTLGEILTTPGYTIGTTNTETITSDDLLSRPGILYVATGGDVNLTASSEKQAANTKTATKTQSEKVLTATAKTIFTKGQIGSGALRVAQAGVSVPHRVTQAIEKKFGAVGKYMSYVDKAAELGTLAPMKAVEFSNNMARAKAGGESTFEALKSASKDTFKTTKKQKKKGEKGLGEKISDGLDKAKSKLTKIDGTEAAESTSKGFINKVKEWLKSKIADNKILSKISEKLNNGICKGKKLTEITNEKLKQMLLNLADTLASKLQGKLTKKIGNASSELLKKIAGAAGTAGLQIIADAVISLVFGMKNADAIMRVEKPNVGEIIISGIVNMISQTLLFGLVEAVDIVDIATTVLERFLGLDDLKKRQAEMQSVVDKYNDENDTNYTVYDYLMKDKIETKINNFFHSRALDGLTSTVEGAGQVVVGGGLNAAKTGGYAIIGGAWNFGKSLFNAAGKSIFGGSNFFENMGDELSTNYSNYADTLKGYAGDTASAVGEGFEHTAEGWIHTFTGKTREEQQKEKEASKASDEEHRGSGGSFGSSSSKNDSNIMDAAGMSSTIATASDKSMDLLASTYGLSTSDFLGKTDDYKDQADQNRQAVANLSNTWININKETTPFFDSITNAMSKATKAVSKNIAVALGLADAKDDDVDIVKIANDDKYLQKRSQTIQDNSTIASLFSGFTGSNSNSTKLQDAAALKVSQAAKNATLVSSSDSAISRTTKTLVNTLNTTKSSSSNKNINVNVSSAAPRAAAFGSGINGNDVKEPVANTQPSENEFVSQKYGKYANKTFGIGTQKEKVSDAGCAPSTAVMVINSNLGNKSRLTMEDALKHASGYIADNGGVTPDYFADEFRRYGFKAAYVAKSDNKQKDVMKHQLMNGKSIVLMGRNTSNRSKKKSPFGPNYHYVVATGMSGDGKYVYISDPEAKTPNVKYAVDEIFNNTDLSIIPVAANSRIADLAGRLRTNLKQLSGKKTSGIIFVGDSRTEGMRDAIGEDDKKKFICKVGEGLAWLKNTAYRQLKEMCDKYPDYYVVFNFGINDLGVDNYISYYKNTIEKNIKNKIIHMSVNPIDQAKAKNAGYTDITNDLIKSFNIKYKEYAGNSYLNTFNYLLKEGFNASDGIHYDNNTYKKLYNKVVDFINNKGDSISTSSGTSGSDESGTTTSSSGKHIKSFSDLISAIGSILSGSWGLSSSESSDLSGNSSSSLSGTSTISTDGISGRVSSDSKVAKLQKQLVAQMKSVEGTLRYAQGNDKYPGSRNPEDGSGDCSSTVQWAYQKVTGKDIGSWTGAQNTSTETTPVDEPHLSRAWDESKLQLGDILLYGNDAERHVEMYYGDGKIIGHGNPSKLGPTVKNIGDISNDWSAKRLNEFMPSGKGTGLFISQKDSKYRSKRIGDETVEQAGCAPAVATMAIDNTKEYNMDKAIKDAKQYKSSGDGVTADYFINTFKKQGYNTIVLTSKKKIINALKQGNNAVLIGQDSKNSSKKRSPFGPNSHYVLATGVSRDEKIIYINDPENNQPNIQYNTNTVLNAVKVAIIPVHSKGGKLNRYNEQLSKALKNYKGKAVNVAQSPLTTQLKNMESLRASDVRKKKIWRYTPSSNSISSTFSGERRATATTYRTNGPFLVLWALRKANIIKSDTGDLYVSGGDLAGSAASAVKEKCNAYKYSNNQYVYNLISDNKIKEGDIVILGSRILVYAGGENWYCADNIGATVSNNIYKTWLLKESFKRSKPSVVYRLKSVDTSIANKNNAVNNKSSVTDGVTTGTDTIDGTSSDSTTAGSEDTFLDKLVNSFALLAEGWGLTSGNTESTDVSSSSSSSSSTSVRGDTVKAKIWNYFKDKGIPDNGIAGAMGNIQSESDFTLDAIESCYKPDIQKAYADDVSSGKISRSGFLGNATYNGSTYGPGYGLVQWTDDDRKGGMYDGTVGKGMRIDSAQGQLDVLWSELNNYYKPSLNAMKTGSVREATEKFMTDYERPADQSQSAKDGRVANAEAILKEMTGKGSGLRSIGIGTKANSAISSINTANSVNKAKDKARLSKLLKSNSGLTSIGVNGRAGNAITSINRNESKSSIPNLKFDDLVGKGSGVDIKSTVKSVSSNRVARSYSIDNSSSNDVNTLLGAIIKLLSQAVDNTASIQSIADAVVTLVDTKAANVTDVETKKQLLDTKAQMLNLIRQQNTTNASTSLSDLITDMEAITSR